MSDQRLRELFNDLADTVPAPQLSAAALAGVQRVRRQRRTALVGAVAASVAVTVIAVSVGSSPEANPPIATPPPPTASASPTPFGPMVIDVAPDRSQDNLARLATALPAEIKINPGRVPKLSASPVDRALALLQSTEDQTTVYVLGTDQQLRVLDAVRLTGPGDEFGNLQSVLDSTSLAPDGTRAAFAQRDEVVVVDLTTGRAQRLPLPGYNENVLWQPGADGLIVEQADRTFLVDLRAGATRQPYGGFDGAASAGAGADIVRLGAFDGQPEVSRWTPGGVLIGKSSLPEGWLAAQDWYGAGWRNGGLVARSVFAPIDLEPSGAGEATVAVDVASGNVVRALLFPRTPGTAGEVRTLQCCEVRGWLGQDIVLLRSLNRLLAWNVDTGALRLVAQLSPGIAALALADVGRR